MAFRPGTCVRQGSPMFNTLDRADLLAGLAGVFRLSYVRLLVTYDLCRADWPVAMLRRVLDCAIRAQPLPPPLPRADTPVFYMIHLHVGERGFSVYLARTIFPPPAH